ncbi:hypothetical protein DLH72_01065 [Candidatus Gracilibacteria bacterium]|nr:MAG: hypothetical protein DLH72_01065 [Candidatus Gracilibacteria bacterium]
MEKNELKKTKRKLTIIFTLMIFFLFSALGISYFVFKYFSEKNFDTNSFVSFVNSVSNSEINRENIINRTRELPKNKKILDKQKFDRKINYILFDDKKNIVSSDLRISLSNDFFEKIVELREKYLSKNNFGKPSGDSEVYYKKKVYYEYDDDDGESELEEAYEKVYIPKTQTKAISEFHFFSDYILGFSGDFVFIKEYNYNFSAFFLDIFRFLLLNLFFSFLIYFLGFKFVTRTFKPVEENISDMKNFIHNAGHELKTPIAVVDSNIQLMLEMKSYDEQMLLELKQEILKLNSLLDSLIKLSDIGSFSEVEKNNLFDLIDEIIKNFSPNLQEKNISFVKNIPENIFVKANRNYLYIFLSNIIGNAIKYNRMDGNIEIIYDNGLKIIDSGIGIEREELNKIFDRFFKSDKSRKSEGFGIGLSLVAKISEIYGWKIKVESELGNGTSFFIKF